MKRIKFEDQQKNWGVVVFLLLTLLFYFLVIFDVITTKNPAISSAFRLIPLILILVINTRPFWFKHLVQWNKKGIYIRLHSFIGTSISFKEINNFTFEHNMLTVNRHKGVSQQFDLSDFDENDSKRLVEIFETYTK